MLIRILQGTDSIDRQTGKRVVLDQKLPSLKRTLCT